MSTKSGEAVLSSTAMAKELLTVALQSRKTYIVLDGIDECSRDQRKDICAWFSSTVDSLPRDKMDDIRCLFISQDDGIARKDFSTIPSINIAPDDNRSDIEAFAKDWHCKITSRFGHLDDASLNFSRVIPARAQGRSSITRVSACLSLIFRFRDVHFRETGA